jgi:hypothetical protein
MTREDLITLGEHKVRRDEHLMLSYLKEFEALFGRKPKCAGCTFKTDWKRFVQGKQTPKYFKMKTNKTFELKTTAKGKIHTYKTGKRPNRSYGNTMTEDFAVNYLTYGTKEEIQQRKKHFKTLPKIEAEKTILVDGEEIKLSEATGKQMNAYAAENNIDFGDAKKVGEKRDIIAKNL